MQLQNKINASRTIKIILIIGIAIISVLSLLGPWTLFPFIPHFSDCHFEATSPDGKHYCQRSFEKSDHIFDFSLVPSKTRYGQYLFINDILVGPTGYIGKMIFSNDAKRIAYLSDNNLILDGEKIDDRNPVCMSFSDDGKHFGALFPLSDNKYSIYLDGFEKQFEIKIPDDNNKQNDKKAIYYYDVQCDFLGSKGFAINPVVKIELLAMDKTYEMQEGEFYFFQKKDLLFAEVKNGAINFPSEIIFNSDDRKDNYYILENKK